MGASFDWSREVVTSDPEYYKWTQWIFTQMVEKDLAYKATTKVNWCSSCKTVLANEQVVSGLCERCDTEVEIREQEQWMLKITEYAEQLLDDLDDLDWPEQIKEMQRNWIGKSSGAEIDFKAKDSEEKIKVFTTRPDTLYGATYVVLAPEHPLLKTLKESVSNWTDVEKYIATAEKKSELERQTDQKEKTGVHLEDITVINPVSDESLPVFVSDYVLGSYGTGAVMAVPAHDERDFEFATKFNLPIKQVVVPHYVDHTNPHQEGKDVLERKALIAVVFDPKEEKYLCLKWKNQPWTTFVTGGIDEGEDPVEAAKREILEETGYSDIELSHQAGTTRSDFFAAHKDVNRVAYNDIIFLTLKSDTKEEVAEEELEQHEAVWLTEEEILRAGFQHAEFEYVWQRRKGHEAYTGHGFLRNSGEFNNTPSEEAKEKITKKSGGEMKTTYRLRDWSVGRQRYWGTPIPVVFDPEGKAYAVSEEHLPWTLPDDVDFTPTGEAPLAKSQELKKRTTDLFGEGWTPEVETMDTFIDSSWYFLRYLDPRNTKELCSKNIQKNWMPIDQYFGGSEHTTLHLLYSRFFQKVLADIGVATEREPYKRRMNRGLILGADGKKMSKSKGNVVDPDEVVGNVGADAVRTYLAFMGPYGEAGSYPWDMDGVVGMRRFLERVVSLQEKITDTDVSEEVEKLLHKTIQKTTHDIENFKFNTAISALMIFLNEAEKKQLSKEHYKTFLKLLSPIAPHIAEELWESLGELTSVHLEEWPLFDESKIIEEAASIAVQVNGKVRATIEVPTDASQEEIQTKIDETDELTNWLEGGYEIKKIVPNRLISLVTK